LKCRPQYGHTISSAFITKPPTILDVPTNMQWAALIQIPKLRLALRALATTVGGGCGAIGRPSDALGVAAHQSTWTRFDVAGNRAAMQDH
jgi:hypothetical protein